MTSAPVRYVIGEDHYLAFALLSAARGFRIAFAIFGTGLVVELALIAVSGGDPLVWAFVGFIALILLLLCNHRFRGLPRLAKAAYREDVQIKEETTLSIDADGYVAAFASGVVRREWINLVKWDEDDRIFAVYSNRQAGHIFPKDQVPAAVIDTIRHHLIASGLEQRGKLRK